MLLQFNVRNALSFKNEAILDLMAGTDNSHAENLIVYKKSRVLPAVAIYGANASGKSNLFKALTAAIDFVRTSHNMQINTPIGIMPFLMDDESRNQRTRFDFIFVYDNIKYEYGFVVDTNKVYEEYLYEYRTSKPSMIFERENVSEYRYTASLKKTLKQYEKKNTDNKLFLATATAWNCKQTENPFKWFADMINTYSRESIVGAMVQALDSDQSGEIKNFANNFLRAADFNISDYEFTVRDDTPEKIPRPPGLSLDDSVLASMKQWELQMFHDIEKNGNTTKVPLPYQWESNGTKLFFAYSPAIFFALKNGETIVIDEIDNGLHPMLVQYLIELFNNHETNPNHAQLIFNTHDVQLLDLDILRRDQIYFVEKENRTGESELYSLCDFSPRKTEKIQKGYLLGRYGAIPNIGGFEW